MKKIVSFIKKNWHFLAFAGVIVFIFLGYYISEQNRIQKQIDAIDTQISSGKTSASNTVDLYIRKRALLEQLKNIF